MNLAEIERLEKRQAGVARILARTEHELAQAHHERVVLEAMLKKHTETEPAAPSTATVAADVDINAEAEMTVEAARVGSIPFSSTPWTRLNRLQAVERALAELRRPSTLRDIEVYLAHQGRFGDNVALISASLAPLKKNDKVEQVQRGVWQVKQQSRTVHFRQPQGVLSTTAGPLVAEKREEAG
jgi:hypothetical protein